ncbi:MAG: hypothetical protein JO322_01815 [Candidatus Eremiobacteraeota bacterium]|nr:hypothetical protein [Candidatus Eremiobacteraeota bacterium]
MSGIPKHFPTWAYDEYTGQGAAGSPALAQTYLTYAESGFNNTKALDDCAGSNSCYSVFYFEPNFAYLIGDCSSVYASGLFAVATESWFLHQSGYSDSAHRLVGHHAFRCKNAIVGEPVYALDQYNPDVRAYIESYLTSYADQYDLYEMDETSGHLLNQFYGTGGGMCQNNPPPHLCSTTQEYPDDASLVQAHGELFSSLTHHNGTPMKLVFNGITMANGEATDLTLFAASSNVVGGLCEDCVDSHGTLRPDDYVPVLNAMAQINAIPNGSFVELNIGNDPAGSPKQIEERTITAAMAWLGYSPGHTIAFPDLEFSSHDLAVWPEYDIVPSDPVESMSSSYADIQVASRVYRREFRSCYNFGVPIGQCAAIVNGNTTNPITLSASWLQLTYGHVVRISGGDIASGGQVFLNTVPFVPAATTLQPGQGILLVR